MAFNYYKILLVFIFLQPFINSITGMAIKYNFPSLVGPLFYFSIFMTSVIYLLRKKKLEPLLFFIIFNVYFLLMFYSERMYFSGYFDLLKVILPYIIFLCVKEIHLNDRRMFLLIKTIKSSFLIYSLLIILSFIFSYQIQAGKGYFGLIYAGNDLTLLLMFSIFFYSLFRSNTHIKEEIFIFISYLLTGSKSIVLFFTAFILKFIKIKNVIINIFLLIIFSAVFYYFIIPLFEEKIFIFLNKADNIYDIFGIYDTEYLLRIFTFGRSDFVYDIIDSDVKVFLDYIIGSGIIGAEIITDGKIGVEMDPVDAFNIYGMIGLFFLVSFYYLPIFKLNIKKISKVFFLIIVIYSILGGHFYNNPLIGFYYGLILGLLNNKNIIIRSYFEDNNSNKYSCAV